jgi:uncharacterized protein YndB with AHSA1/START domain
MKIIKHTIEINAPKEKVWDVLTKDALNRQWYAEFGAGSKAETTWEEGSQALFTDDENNGIVATVSVNRYAEELIVCYKGILMEGTPHYTGEYADHVKNGYESYLLTEDKGITTLVTAASMSEAFMDMMGEAWDRAKDKIKQLAEAQ